jgi:predicted signal transduction protein with EAL and GGDEF domain
MDTDVETSEIIRIIIMLAHGLGLKVVAERVETQVQADMLKDLNCELAQGYFYSRPVPSETIDQLRSRRRFWAPSGHLHGCLDRICLILLCRAWSKLDVQVVYC